MRRFLDVSILLLGVLYYLGCDNQSQHAQFHSDLRTPGITDSLFHQLVLDAQLIAYDYLITENEATDQLELPEKYVNPLVIALQNLYSDENLEVVKEIKNLGIHAFCPNRIHEVTMQADSSNAAIQNWLHGEPTGNSNLDQLIQNHNLSLRPISQNLNYYLVRSELGINTKALAEQLEQMKEIETATPNICAGDGSQIKLVEFNYSYLDLEFSYGWGDCPAGCIYRHNWLIRIFSNGRTELLKEFGDPLP